MSPFFIPKVLFLFGFGSASFKLLIFFFIIIFNIYFLSYLWQVFYSLQVFLCNWCRAETFNNSLLRNFFRWRKFSRRWTQPWSNPILRKLESKKKKMPSVIPISHHKIIFWFFIKYIIYFTEFPEGLHCS